MSTTHRITRFGLRNFKAFHYLDDFGIRPLTVLVGANSSGKSSIFQSLLLLKQSSLASLPGGLLKFDGDWTKLGRFATVISDFDTSRKLEYRFTVELPVSAKDAHHEFPHIKAAANLLNGSSLVVVETTFVFEWDPDAQQVVLEELSMVAQWPGFTTNQQDIVLGYGRNSGLRTQNLPVPFEMHLDKLDFAKFWPTLLRGTSNKRRSYFIPLPELFRISLDLLQGSLEQRLAYLGPVRVDPLPFYPVEEEPTIGPRGAGTIPYLLRHQQDQIDYVPSPTEDTCQTTLLDALNDWLQRMNITPRLTIDPIESVAYTAAVRSTSATSKSVNLAQVGFGISQLLPVLVMSLKGPQGSWLLFEQPEIHLHPRLQAELGDVLLCAAKAGKTVMVETHSDHLVNRLRRRIAEDTTGTLANLVQILFVHAGTPDNPSSYVEPLSVDDTGTIINCPADFFSETADETFAILQARQQKARRAKP